MLIKCNLIYIAYITLRDISEVLYVKAVNESIYRTTAIERDISAKNSTVEDNSIFKNTFYEEINQNIPENMDGIDRKRKNITIRELKDSSIDNPEYSDKKENSKEKISYKEALMRNSSNPDVKPEGDSNKIEIESHEDANNSTNTTEINYSEVKIKEVKMYEDLLSQKKLYMENVKKMEDINNSIINSKNTYDFTDILITEKNKKRYSSLNKEILELNISMSEIRKVRDKIYEESIEIKSIVENMKENGYLNNKLALTMMEFYKKESFYIKRSIELLDKMFKIQKLECCARICEGFYLRMQCKDDSKPNELFSMHFTYAKLISSCYVQLSKIYMQQQIYIEESIHKRSFYIQEKLN